MKAVAESFPAHLLPLDIGMPPEQLLRTLRMNALLAHQTSVGRGDELVQILKNTIAQMESTHRRVQNMSTILFGVGLAMLAFGIIFVFRGEAAWGTLISGTGGVASLAATFWTAPLEKMSRSVRDLVKLETAFLGYIRVIGELDSAFQMQYLDILAGTKEVTLENVMNNTVQQMKTMMETTVKLIEQYIGDKSADSKDLKQQIDEMSERLKTIEKAQKA